MIRYITLLIFLCMLILSSCTIEKRRYFKGYHITWHGKKNESIAFVEKDSTAKEKSPRIAPPKEVMQTTAEHFDSTFQNKSRVIAVLKTQKQKTTKAVKTISEKISFHPLTLDTFHASITPRFEQQKQQKQSSDFWSFLLFLSVILLIIGIAALVGWLFTGVSTGAIVASGIMLLLIILGVVIILLAALWLLLEAILQLFAELLF